MAIAATYIAANSFSVSGDMTSSDFPINIRVKADCGADGFKYGTVSSSAFSSVTTVTLVMDAANSLTANLVGVFHSADEPASLPDHAAQHGASGRDAITPASIGASSKSFAVAMAIALR